MSGAVLSLPWFGLSLMGDAPRDEADLSRDARLVEAAERDPDDYRHLVQLYQPRVYATALRMLGEPSEAHDVAQEAFVKAYKALGRFEKGRPFGPWVCTIAANVARDHLRRPFRRLLQSGLSPAQARKVEPVHLDEDQMALDDVRDDLAQALLQLPVKLRQALVLRFVSDLSVEEVAQALDIKESAAKMRLKRGLERLRELLPEDPRAQE